MTDSPYRHYGRSGNSREAVSVGIRFAGSFVFSSDRHEVVLSENQRANRHFLVHVVNRLGKAA